jgi:hypothetical protein
MAMAEGLAIPHSRPLLAGNYLANLGQLPGLGE